MSTQTRVISIAIFLAQLIFSMRAFSVTLADPLIKYTHVLPLKIYVSDLTPKMTVESEVNAIQSYFNQCEILVDFSFEQFEPIEQNEWETFWFNNYNITSHEQSIAKIININSHANLVFVNNVNWTLKGQGTWGAAYAPFLLEKMPMPAATKSFLKHSLKGLAVVGQYRAHWTATHEVAHAIMNLEHVSDSENIMHSGQGDEHYAFDEHGMLISDKKPKFTSQQCTSKNNPILIKLSR